VFTSGVKRIPALFARRRIEFDGSVSNSEAHGGGGRCTLCQRGRRGKR